MLRVFGAGALATSILLGILGCAAPKRFDRLSLDMSKAEVIRVLGKPSSTSAGQGTEILRYRFGSREQAPVGNSAEYFVMLVNDRVASFGRLDDFAVQPRIHSTAIPIRASAYPAPPAQAAVADSGKREAIRQLYLTLQQREPDWQGWNYWMSNPAPIDEIKQQMMAGIEYQTKQQIIQVFRDVLQRPPVAQELHAWYSKAAESGYDTAEVRAALEQPDGGRHEAIRWLYKYLQQREPDEQGWDYWTNYKASIPEIIPMMMAGVEYTQKQQIIQYFRQHLNRDPSDTKLHRWYSRGAGESSPSP